jgi:hypothetical protein
MFPETPCIGARAASGKAARTAVHTCDAGRRIHAGAGKLRGLQPAIPPLRDAVGACGGADDANALAAFGPALGFRGDLRLFLRRAAQVSNIVADYYPLFALVIWNEDFARSNPLRH